MNPLVVEVWRGDWIESRHLVDVVVVDASGSIRLVVGDPERRVLPRSAVKPIQAIPLVQSGAADRFALSDIELALACASHSGEAGHVAAVGAWLGRIGLGVDRLACGMHYPNRGASDWSQAASGAILSAAHNNCSGKHAGYLTLAVHLGVDPEGYLEPDHPVQQLVTAVLAELSGVELGARPAVDGCGVPVHALPLVGLARAAARWAAADPTSLGADRSAAARRLAAAVRAEPWFIAGTGRLDTDLVRASAGGVITKTGAEGVYAGYLADLGLGVAIKTADGAARGGESALGWVLEELGILETNPALAEVVAQRRVLRNHAGRQVGRISIAGGRPRER